MLAIALVPTAIGAYAEMASIGFAADAISPYGSIAPPKNFRTGLVMHGARSVTGDAEIGTTFGGHTEDLTTGATTGPAGTVG